MIHTPITLGTAGLLGLIYMALTVNVVRYRLKLRVMLGDDAGAPEGSPLFMAIRMHGNFIEYVPLCLILIGGLEAAGASHDLVFGLAGSLVLARALHPFGLAMPAPNPLRAGGALLTWAVLVVASLSALFMVV
ncbi:MAG: MAPEG family protein [Acidocella sp.]|nr:MAPEG family protein [Acidocella sp.]